MQCENIGEKISAYLDGELETDATREIESHLSQCSECQELFEDFKRLHHTFLQMPSIEPESNFVSQIIMQIETGIKVDKTTHHETHLIIKKLLQVIETLFERLGVVRPAFHGHLEEFNDFPPLSMGDIYCRLMGQPT